MTKIDQIMNNEAKANILREIVKYPPSREFSRRKLAKMADVPKSTANRKIDELVDLGILKSKPIEGSNTHLITINKKNKIISKLKKLFEEEKPSAEEVEEIGGKIELSELESYLWEAADILRGNIDSADYKNYIFGLLFLKRLSDRFSEECDKLIGEKDIDKDVAYKDPDLHHFYLPKKAHWSHIQKQKRDIGAAINKAFEIVEDENDTIENNVLTSIDFNDKERLPDAVLEELIIHFSKKRFRNEDLEDSDIFGRAYEYLIRQFADDAGKKGGEFYTPREVVKVLVQCLDPQSGMRVYDPCCGSGGMLIYSAQHIRDDNGGSMENISLYGQEKNLNTWAIGQMNMLLHNLPDANIAKGDTMRNPKFLEDDGLMVFDRVIANPMWNQKKWSKEYLKGNQPYNRFKYGLPPKNSADWAWIQHMLASLNKTGKMGVVLDNGVLFRSRSEGKIRKKVLEDDLIEAVIALPSNLFYNTSSPGCILILNKDKPEERKDKVMFIYAEDQTLRESGIKIYDELSNQNQLTPDGIKKIVDTYKNLNEEPHHSRLVDIEEIEENDYNLNVPRYVDATEPKEQVNVSKANKERKRIEEKRDKIIEKLNQVMESLSYE